jgi:hypothetical protein
VAAAAAGGHKVWTHSKADFFPFASAHLMHSWDVSKGNNLRMSNVLLYSGRDNFS